MIGRNKEIIVKLIKEYNLDEYERVNFGLGFILSKRKCGMKSVSAKLRKTVAPVIAISADTESAKVSVRHFTGFVSVVRNFYPTKSINICSVDIRLNSPSCCLRYIKIQYINFRLEKK